VESGWTGQRLSCPLTRTRTLDGPVTATMHLLLTGLFIPTLGCWKITGLYKREELSYVVWVAN